MAETSTFDLRYTMRFISAFG